MVRNFFLQERYQIQFFTMNCSYSCQLSLKIAISNLVCEYCFLGVEKVVSGAPIRTPSNKGIMIWKQPPHHSSPNPPKASSTIGMHIARKEKNMRKKRELAVSQTSSSLVRFKMRQFKSKLKRNNLHTKTDKQEYFLCISHVHDHERCFQ